MPARLRLPPRPSAAALRRSLTQPLALLLVIGGLVGVTMAVLVPAFAGIDEPYHFLRARALTGGTLMPTRGEVPGDVTGGGLCVDRAVLQELFDARRPYLERLIPGFDGGDPLKVVPSSPQCGPGESFVDVATFSWYSPVGYLSQALGVGVGRLVGAGLVVQATLARLASLAAYLALCGLALRWAPRGRWALLAVALLPVSLFQAVTSLSPDGLTLAAVIAVVAGALRAASPPEGVPRPQLLAEAALACGLLAAAKPTYVVMAAVYLVAWRRTRATLVPAALGIVASFAWHGAFRSLFVCDVRYFGIGTDPSAQTDNLLHRPWGLLTATARAFVDHGGRWTVDTAAVAERVVPWGVLASAVVLVGFAALSCLEPSDRAGAAADTAAWWQRLVLVGSGLAGLLAVLAGWLVSCSRPELRITNPPHARLLVPVLPPILVGLVPTRRARPGTGDRPVPPAAIAAWCALVLGYSMWLVALGLRMR